MSVFGEVRDALKFVAEAINDARTVADAVKDGRAYLDKSHPEIREDVIGLMEEIRKTMSGVNRISSVITQFRFTDTGSDRDKQPARFNDYVIAKQAEIHDLHHQIPELKGSCRRVLEHRNRLVDRAGKDRWWLWGRLLEKSADRSRQLDSTLLRIYGADDDIIRRITRMITAGEAALADVSAALGPPGFAYPDKVSEAAGLLGRYAQEFSSVQRQSRVLVQDLSEEIAALQAPVRSAPENASR